MLDIDINEFFEGLSKLPNKGLTGCKMPYEPLHDMLPQLAKVFNIDKQNIPDLIKKLREFIKAYDNKINN
jgi:predicted DNA-binding protein YlxM (UPF0122 family)